MGKKKTQLKPNQFDLGNGFLLEIVKHPKGDVNGDLEGYLSHQGVEIELTNKLFYSDNVEAINDFEKRIIPEYISGTNIKVFKYLDNEHMFNFTRDYLLNNKDKITYGYVLDMIQILKEDGYEIPCAKDKVQISNLMDFHSCVNRLGKEFKEHLILFGFNADRNVNITTDHPSFEKHLDLKNIVFTRYPWSHGFKALSAINDFVTFTDNDLSKEIDMVTLQKVSGDTHKYLSNVLSLFNKLNLRTKQNLEDLDYALIRKEFKKHIKENKQELLKVWSKRRPLNYGVYPRS